jgi:glycolate oxidase FAD binding subunit
VLWDGRSVWVGLAGRGVDVVQTRKVLGAAGRFEAVGGPPVRPAAARRSLPPAELARLPALAGADGWVAEIGVGVVHCESPAAARLPLRPAAPGVAQLHRRIKERFDPTGRLNPGRSPLLAEAVGAS